VPLTLANFRGKIKPKPKHPVRGVLVLFLETMCLCLWLWHDFKHTGATGLALALHCLAAVLHGYLFRVFHLLLGTAFYAISFHVFKESSFCK